MRRNSILMGIAPLAAALALMALACDDDEPSTEDAEAQLCGDLAALDAAAATCPA